MGLTRSWRALCILAASRELMVHLFGRAAASYLGQYRTEQAALRIVADAIRRYGRTAVCDLELSDDKGPLLRGREASRSGREVTPAAARRLGRIR
jgi:hypothetical protein